MKDLGLFYAEVQVMSLNNHKWLQKALYLYRNLFI
jgi:hypothetical protein